MCIFPCYKGIYLTLKLPPQPVHSRIIYLFYSAQCTLALKAPVLIECSSPCLIIARLVIGVYYFLTTSNIVSSTKDHKIANIILLDIRDAGMVNIQHLDLEAGAGIANIFIFSLLTQTECISLDNIVDLESINYRTTITLEQLVAKTYTIAKEIQDLLYLQWIIQELLNNCLL